MRSLETEESQRPASIHRECRRERSESGVTKDGKKTVEDKEKFNVELIVEEFFHKRQEGSPSYNGTHGGKYYRWYRH